MPYFYWWIEIPACYSIGQISSIPIGGFTFGSSNRAVVSIGWFTSAFVSFVV